MSLAGRVILGTAAVTYADLAARKGIGLDPGSHESIVAGTDEGRLTRIVANLVTMRSRPLGPAAANAVGVRRHGAAVVLSVEDTAGPGAGTSIRAALAGNGSGLGLRVVAVLSHAVGGELVVEDGASGAVAEMRLPH
jgi:C4-dicarboxylate-specific signal transduction histidine kinase